jgi:hypothetical protein
MQRMQAAALTALAAVAFAGPAAAQDTFDWRGRIASGNTVEIRNINGAVRATAGSGDEVRVHARKTARRSNPDDVRIEVVPHDGGVTICAVYPPDRRGRENTCERGGGRSNVNDNDVNVEFTVELPRGVRFTGVTVNGEVVATGLTADVDARTVNGDVRVSTSGLARANTVNGSIDAEFGRTDWRDKLSFETVNGGITLTFTGQLDAEVTASSVNGDIQTDYPMTVRGSFGPRRVTGTVGAGGRRLELQTVNGDIRLRRR